MMRGLVGRYSVRQLVSSPGRSRKRVTLAFANTGSPLSKPRPSRPSAVLGSCINGATDSAINEKPPVPDVLSPLVAGSFRNAPTLTRTKQAKAISARLRTERPG